MALSRSRPRRGRGAHGADDLRHGGRQTDTDGDFAPDAATYTFALPACSFTGFRGGTLEVTGTIVLSDPTPEAADLAATATLNDFKFRFTEPGREPHLLGAPERHPHADRQRRGRLAEQPGHRGAERAESRGCHRRPQPAAELHPGAGESLAFGEPLPDGTFTESGTFTWSRGSVSRTFTVTTVAPLVWDASCTTDRKIASGEIHATLADGGYIRTVWTACGEDPTRSFVPAG